MKLRLLQLSYVAGLALFAGSSSRADSAPSAPVVIVRTVVLGSNQCTLRFSKSRLALSEQLLVAISVSGPAPVYVDVPSPLVQSNDWRATALPAESSLEADERERWHQSFELEPFATGEKVPIVLAPIRIRSGNEIREWTLKWEPFEVTVTSTVPEADLSFARTITPPAPLPDATSRAAAMRFGLSGALLVLAVAAGCVYLWLRSRRRPANVSPLQRALAELARVEQIALGPQRSVQLAQLLRQFFEDQFAIAATRLTTDELLDALRQANGLADDHISFVVNVLSQADLVKFSPDLPVADSRRLCEDCRTMLLAFTIPTAQVVSDRQGLRDS